MSTRVLVIGGVAGGASTAARIRRLDESAEIIIFEKDEFVSYSNCALPYYLSGTVSAWQNMILMTPQAFKARFNIDVRTKNEVLSIDRAAKEITVRGEGGEYREHYDKLVIATGAKAIRPASIKGIDAENVFTVKTVGDVRSLREYAQSNGVKNIAVIGGGFIGLEAAENLKKAGYNVSLIEGAEQILLPFDNDMVQSLHLELMNNGIDVHLSSMLTEIGPRSVKVTSGGRELEIPAEAVVLSIGVAPQAELAAGAGLEIGKSRGIKVNRYFQTSDPDIYAVGDVIESYNAITGAAGILALAGPAQREARAAADHICGRESSDIGFIGSSCIRVFSRNAACTGLNERAAKAAGLSYDYAYVLPPDKVAVLPGSAPMQFKLLFEVPSGRLLGAQAIGTGDAVSRVNVVAALLRKGGTVEDLKDVELCYAPVFNTPKDVVQMAALVASNMLEGRIKYAHIDQLRSLVESGAFIVDVREENEYELSHIKGAHNIPLSQFRERMNEIPKDRPVYLHCRTSQRSYYAICELLGNGYTDVYNISGSYLGFSLYEYFRDKTTGREPILTDYNLN